MSFKESATEMSRMRRSGHFTPSEGQNLVTTRINSRIIVDLVDRFTVMHPVQPLKFFYYTKLSGRSVTRHQRGAVTHWVGLTDGKPLHLTNSGRDISCQQLFLHMNSHTWSGSEVRWVPHLILFPRLAWDHSDSMDCV
ncbi:hypothetical protein M514_11415 [Trichuris suis]|uniref:Uncharacterized protein n=1 Tax=Trichuris suis TaxID=68888 RepID=A0A085MUD5_9BILA|nr:hypothetical protein M514_11415 [Trichuris suis]